MKNLTRDPATALAILLAGTPALLSAEEPSISFARDIRPILSNACFKCHGPDEAERKGGPRDGTGLRLDTEEGAREDMGGRSAVVPGHPEESELIARILATEEDEIMPPPKSGSSLTPAEVKLLEDWIKGGAKYSKHWSYEPPVAVDPPKPGIHPIDAFIRDRLEKEELQPQPQADRATLARRLSFDLTGLPPAPEDVDAFITDQAPDAYERLVDRLLASPAFGEHWGRQWLDLARYADSAGYADDPSRSIWAFRDYVIRSFNANKPFDQFTIEQIAGDLLPDPTEEQLIATAFHRNTMTNSEGGTNDEEFRTAAVVDRVNTTMAVWMGTSMACAQCHTHKYDPITHIEYFRMFAFLNNTADADRRDEAPLLNFFSEEQKAQRVKLEAGIAEVEARLKEHQLREITPETAADQKALTDLQKQLAALKPSTVPILRELPEGKRRKTHLHLRGNYLTHGDEVTEGTPLAIFPLPEEGAKNRLTLARWLIDPANPLTARVIANRYWESLFGIGIVRTSEEFGAQGDAPTHPELLDWLAVELVRGGWDIKRFIRLIVTSETYRQSSKIESGMAERDPDNRLLARGPRVRLTAEMVRDQALAASGLLSPVMFGPSVRPVRPALGLSAAFGGGLDWKASTGGDQHRRGLYTEWRRTSPYPSMATFDAPSREVCTVRRDRSNTPLQALVLLNDPVYVEASQALARRLTAEASPPDQVIREGFRRVLSRMPSDTELKRLLDLHGELLADYRADPKKAAEMATVPIGPLPAGADPAELAAWTAIAGVLFNLDETLLKR